MSLKQHELDALADIQGDLLRADPSLARSFDVLSGWRARTFWTAAALVVLGGVVAFWALGFRAVGVIAMLLVLAAPLVAVLAADQVPRPGVAEPRTTDGPRPQPRTRRTSHRRSRSGVVLL
jgi:hypothetical protein